MKKAVIVGGSNGIGLAIAKELIQQGYHACILDRQAPAENAFSNADDFTYYPCDLLDLDEALVSQLAAQKDVALLMITAGFGRVADFEYLHTAEIERLLTVNTVSSIKILRLFYDRIKSAEHRRLVQFPRIFCLRSFQGSIVPLCRER